MLQRWITKHGLLLANAGSLFGTTLITSGIGFAYWWSAARLFSAAAVGFSSTAISAMTLLGTGGILGLGTLLVGELPRQPGKEASFISAALLLVSGIGAALGIIIAVAAPFISRELAPLGANFGTIALFAAGASLTAVTTVLDQAVIGLWRGGVQLFRNGFFSVVKLALIVAAGLWLSRVTWLTIYGTWTIGSALSLLPLVGYVLWKGGRLRDVYRPQWKLLWKLGPEALQHHVLNLIQFANVLVLPLLVTSLISATTSAWFYVALMIANVVFSVSLALTTVLLAAKYADPKALAQKMVLTLTVSLIITLFAVLVICLWAEQLLGLFGHAYAEHAAWCLRLLSLAAFPLILKNHYFVLCRIQNQMLHAIFRLSIGLVLELAGAALGAYLGGLTGLSLVWTIVLCIEAMFMSLRVYRAVRQGGTPLLRILIPSMKAGDAEEGLA